MNYAATLHTVRELSERATLAPSPKRLLFGRPAVATTPRRAVATWEELHPPRIGGKQTAHGRHPDSRNPNRKHSGLCADCGKRHDYCRCWKNAA